MKQNRTELIELGGCHINNKLDVVVSQNANGDLFVGQRQTFYENGIPVRVFRKRATLCVDADTLQTLVDALQDVLDNLHK